MRAMSFILEDVSLPRLLLLFGNKLEPGGGWSDVTANATEGCVSLLASELASRLTHFSPDNQRNKKKSAEGPTMTAGLVGVLFLIYSSRAFNTGAYSSRSEKRITQRTYLRARRNAAIPPSGARLRRTGSQEGCEVRKREERRGAGPTKWPVRQREAVIKNFNPCVIMCYGGLLRSVNGVNYNKGEWQN